MQNIYCFTIFQNGKQISASIQGNQILQIPKFSKNNIKIKPFINLNEALSLSIVKIQILPNHKFVFHFQLILKNKKVFNIIIHEKNVLEWFIKQISNFCVIKGIQQIANSIQKIGEGSFAQVFKVITNYYSKMALKTFNKVDLNIRKNRLAYQNQLNIMRTLSNLHVVSLNGIFETEKNLYMKMEYFPMSLKDYIKKGLSIKFQKKNMKQLLTALQHFKQKNIIHRDLKPENVMIRGGKKNIAQCVVIDFGLATFTNQQTYLFKRCGTPGYLAPQIANMANSQIKLTSACDMFSLGCIFYKMQLNFYPRLTGKSLFQGPNNKEVLKKNRRIQIHWNTFDQFSQREKDLLLKMLQKQPQKRITPQNALNHCYFNDQIDDEDYIFFQYLRQILRLVKQFMIFCILIYIISIQIIKYQQIKLKLNEARAQYQIQLIKFSILYILFLFI